MVPNWSILVQNWGNCGSTLIFADYLIKIHAYIYALGF